MTTPGPSSWGCLSSRSVSLPCSGPWTQSRWTAPLRLLCCSPRMLLVFAVICHVYFFSDTEAADAAVSGAAAEATQVQAHETTPVLSQPLFDTPSVTSRRVRLAVPVFSVITLVVLAALVASGQGTTLVFVPIFLTMVVVYVLASIYLFKVIIEKERVSTGQSGEADQSGHEVH